MPRATITLYIDTDAYEQETRRPLDNEQLQEYGRQVNEDAAGIYGYEAWKSDMPECMMRYDVFVGDIRVASFYQFNGEYVNQMLHSAEEYAGKWIDDNVRIETVVASK